MASLLGGGGGGASGAGSSKAKGAGGIWNGLRKLVSQDRYRYKDADYDLDLTYITDRVIAMSMPASGIEVMYRNDIDEVARFFHERHKDHFLIWNLSERGYDYSKFNYQILEFGFPDHHNPPLQLLFKIVESMDNWLNADPENVAVVHCKAGRGRTGTVIACYLTFTGMFDNALDALHYFGQKRSIKGEGVTNPAQRRYVEYYTSVLNNSIDPTPRPMVLKRMLFHTMPHFSSSGGCRPYIQVFKGRQLIYNSAWKDPEIRHYGPSDGGIAFEIDHVVHGDVLIKCYHHTHHLGVTSREFMFRLSLHTAFVEPGALRLTKDLLDGPHKDNRFEREFWVELVFDSPSPEQAEQATKEEAVDEKEGSDWTFVNVAATQRAKRGARLDAAAAMGGNASGSGGGAGRGSSGHRKEPSSSPLYPLTATSGSLRMKKGLRHGKLDDETFAPRRFKANTEDPDDVPLAYAGDTGKARSVKASKMTRSELERAYEDLQRQVMTLKAENRALKKRAGDLGSDSSDEAPPASGSSHKRRGGGGSGSHRGKSNKKEDKSSGSRGSKRGLKAFGSLRRFQNKGPDAVSGGQDSDDDAPAA